MKKNMLFLILAVSLFNNSCNNDERERHKLNEEFISNYANENFSQFKNRSFFVRGFDNGNPIVFVYDDRPNHTDAGSGCLFYSVVIDKKNLQIVRSSRDALADSCMVDEPLSKQLALKFIGYNIPYLEVDSNNNVFIRTYFNERPADLIRFSDPRFIAEKYKKNWKVKCGNWYERIED